MKEKVKMKVLKAKTSHQNKRVFNIEDISHIENMPPLEEIINGNELINPVELIEHEVSNNLRMGAQGMPYKEKRYSTLKGSQRLKAALKLGYTHIEGVIVNECKEIKEFNLKENSFIGSWTIPVSICDELINHFNNNLSQTIDGVLGKEVYNVKKDDKDSKDLCIDSDNFNYPFDEYRLYLNECFNLYKKKFEALNFVNKISVKESWNIQYYKPKGGFKVWHTENDGYNDESRKRALVFMTYLNDVEDGGTHFYYEGLTVPCIKGLTLIWPADWTHLHKGQISNTKEKYIATGWLSYE